MAILAAGQWTELPNRHLTRLLWQRGDIEHLRVCNAIRIHPSDMEVLTGVPR